MENPSRSDMELEAGIKPLIAALKIPKLMDACRILFVNGDTLNLSAPLGQIGIVTLQGSEEANIEGADFIISESQMQIFDIGKHVVPQMIQTFGESIVSASVEVTSIDSEKERQSVITAKIMDKVNSDGAKQFIQQVMPYIGDAIKPASEMLVGGLYKFFYGKYRDQLQTISGFEDVFSSLKRMGLMSPFLSLAMCQSCNNYELVFSKLARFTPKCPKCGAEWPVLAVNELTPALANLKMKNADLPVFISAYLRSKSPFMTQVFPNAEFNRKSGTVEVDVFIPDTKTGIECKCYTNNFTVTDSTINSEAGKIKKQIRNYLSLGLTRVIVVTNYNDSDTSKLRANLTEKLTGLKGLEQWSVLGNDINSLAKLLDEESSNIDKAMSNLIQQEFDHRIEKQLAEKQKKTSATS